MKYYHEKTLENTPFDEVIEKVREALQSEGFGILTEIDVQKTLKDKLDEDFRPYTILGACNPPFAHKALLTEDKIGTMLPCNVIVQQQNGSVEVAVVDPVASMLSAESEELEEIAREIRDKLKSALDAL